MLIPGQAERSRPGLYGLWGALVPHLTATFIEESDVDADFEDDSDMLRSYCPVRMSEGDDMFEMHRLVQFLNEEMARAAREASRIARTVR